MFIHKKTIKAIENANGRLLFTPNLVGVHLFKSFCILMWQSGLCVDNNSWID